ncbi:MAG: chemotaxis protein CheW [Chromatiales bacterium]|jgi:chemosensory pili system protein ChpC
MSQAEVSEVRCVLIPLATSRLLLPNAVVAEVMDYQTPVPRERMPDWYLGDLVWRGTSVPMVSIEGMLGGSVAVPGVRSRTLVLNTLNGNKKLSHIGLITQALPTLVRVNLDNLEPSKIRNDLGTLINLPVTVNNSLALIPDLDELERQVHETRST